MSNPVIQNQKFFLGVNGEQSGPLTEVEMVEKIRSGSVPADALIWFEGLQEWQSVQTIPAFSEAFAAKAGSAPPPSASGGFKPLNAASVVAPAVTPSPINYRPSSSSSGANSELSTFSQGAAEPVFKVEKDIAGFLRASKPVIAMVVVGVLALCGGGYYFLSANSAHEIVIKPRPRVVVPPSRQEELSKAQSELLLNPTTSLDALKKIILENPKDEISKQAMAASIDYYKIHSPQDAGKLLLSAGFPEDAVQYFMMDPPVYDQAESALAAATDTVKDPVKRRKIIIQDIDLLLGPLNQRAKAVEKIRLLEKDYPGQANPYSYYLKTTDEKLRDIFNRISFYFVKSLLGVFESEMPQINLSKHPLVELRRGHDNRYRIVGVYAGDVMLNHDHLSDINFQFWLDRERWILVETNLTPERNKAAALEKERLKNEAATPEEMLRALEQTFRTQFPQNGLHERVSEMKTKAPE